MTTSVRTVPNVEALVGKVIRDALSIDVSSGLKKTPSFPAIRVQRIGGIHPRKRALDAAQIQIDAWGDTKTDAFNAIADARTAVLNMEGVNFTTTGNYPENVQVAEVTEVLGISWLPDTEVGKDRYLAQFQIISHLVEGA